ncbi:MAG: hypothetical protein K2X87_15645 [Gemmataceae bacterium]|nr:hypothetical protein [Gemmataceae bacterium]
MWKSLTGRPLVAAAVAVVAGSAGAADARAADLVLDRLEVIRQQEANGDELTLSVDRDKIKGAVVVGRWNLVPGPGFVPVGAQVHFARDSWVTLTERDKRFGPFGKKPKSLGTLYIPAVPGAYAQDFTWNGAWYRLHYRVVP